MSEVLIIRLSARAHAPSSAVAVIDGHAAARVETGSLSELARHAEGRRVIVLAPAADVLLTDAAIPVKGAARVLQAMPFALEEQLASDVSMLHFAIGKRRPDGHVPVAVVDRSRLENWLERLAAASITAHTLLAESSVLPTSPDTVSLWIEGDDACVHCGTQPPVSGSIDTVEALLDICGVDLEFGAGADDEDGNDESAGDAFQRPSTLLVFATAEDRERQADLLARLEPRVDQIVHRELTGSPLRLLATQTADGDHEINILQGDFAPATAVETWWRPWRAAAMLMVAVIATALGVQAVHLLQLRAAEARLDQRIATLLRETCPEERAIVDARSQMQRCVNAAIGGGGERDEVFLGMLSTLAVVLAETPDTRIEQISFRNRVLDLKFNAPNVETLERIKQLVAERGSLEMEIESTRPSQDGVESQAEIRKPVA